MSLLFKISILALIALLWATFGIARNIYRARQRHRKSLEAAKAKQQSNVPGL